MNFLVLSQIFEMEKVPIELISWPIVPTSSMSGFVDFIRDSQTISNIRKDYGNLHTFWLQQFGPTGSATNELATYTSPFAIFFVMLYSVRNFFEGGGKFRDVANFLEYIQLYVILSKPFPFI